MGFSTQHTRQGRQYAPNTRNNVVNSVFNTMASFNSSLNSNSNSLLGHIRSWQRSRRLRSLSKTSVVNPMNNLCYQSMLPKSCLDISSHTASAPVVSFRNNGEGAIAMQLVNSGRRVLVNENQLYSMHLASKENATLGYHTSGRTLSENCYASLEPPPQEETEFTKNQDPLNQELWYYGNIDREKATQLVARACTGTFLVRPSTFSKNSYALTVKVPLDYSTAGVCHYLILRTDEGKFKIKGFNKEFETVQSLIIHHTIMREQLPCTLVNRGNGSLYGRFYTYGKSCNALHQPDSDDLMVDIDLDPTYQKILDNFRKVMAHCS